MSNLSDNVWQGASNMPSQGPSTTACATQGTTALRPEREERHRDAQGYESLAGKLRKIGNYLANTFSARGDAGQLNSQLASLTWAAEIIDWLAQEERIAARSLGDGASSASITEPDAVQQSGGKPS